VLERGLRDGGTRHTSGQHMLVCLLAIFQCVCIRHLLSPCQDMVGVRGCANGRSVWCAGARGLDVAEEKCRLKLRMQSI
jgi:hypothetical protein